MKKVKDNYQLSVTGDLLLPNNTEMEAQVLAMLLSDLKAQAEILDIIKSKDVFFDLQHRTIYAACLAMFGMGRQIDIRTLAAYLRENGELESVGGPAALADIGNGYSYNYISYCYELTDLYKKREIMQATAKAQAQIMEGAKASEVIDDLQTTIVTSAMNGGKQTTYTADALLASVQDNMLMIGKDGENALGTRIRLKDLRSILGFWHNSDLVILAARPAMGKTAFVETILSDFAAVGKTGVFISIEMSAQQMGYRLLSSLTANDPRKYSAAEIQASAKYPNDELFTTVYPELCKRYEAKFKNNNAPLLYIDDSGSVNIHQIRAKFLQIKAVSKNEIGGLVIDYLGLIDDNGNHAGDNKANRIADITRALKSLAKEFDVPVILLCQLSRALEARADKRPILADLRDSGAIEQDADIVLFLHRPEYYRDCPDEIEHPLTGLSVSKEGYGEIIVAKHRNGGLGVAPFKFIGHCTAIVDYNLQPLNSPVARYEVPDEVPF